MLGELFEQLRVYCSMFLNHSVMDWTVLKENLLLYLFFGIYQH